MGRERGAAHAHDAALPDDTHQFLRRKLLHLLGRSGLNLRGKLILVVVFNDHAHHGHPADVRSHLHRFHHAGYGGMNRDTQPFIIPDFLSHRDMVTLFHQRLAGRADMLAQGNHQNIRFRKHLNPLFGRIPFILLWMDAAENGKRHHNHLFRVVSHMSLSYCVPIGLSTKNLSNCTISVQ